MTAADTQAAPVEAPKADEPSAKPTQQESGRPPQTEEVLCTICGMRSCWR